MQYELFSEDEMLGDNHIDTSSHGINFKDKRRTAYRVNEVAEILGIARSTVYAMMKDERLRYSVFCGIRFIAGSDIPGLGKRQAQETTPGNNKTMSQNNDLTPSL